MQEHRIDLSEVSLNVVSAGPSDGPLVLLLHGFPQHGASWWRQIGALADAGYRVWAPDQRGYNTSSKPSELAAYHLDRLAGDVVELIDVAGSEKAHVVGHDWGGGVAWWTAIRHASRVAKLGILNMPHPQVLVQRHLRFHIHRCWYFYFFMLPRVPEMVLARDDRRAMIESIRSTGNPDAFTDADLEAMRQVAGEPGALTGMINWYRAVMRLPLDLTDVRVRVPTLIIWGARDRFISRTMADHSLALCDDGRLELMEKASHWVQSEEPERVNALLGRFLGSGHSGLG